MIKANKPVLRSLLTVSLILFSASMHAENRDAHAWLDQMSHAMQNKNYSGTFVYLHDDVLETMQIAHRSSNDGVMEKLLSLNGEAREIIRDDSVVTCIWPDSRSVMVDKSRPRSSFPGAVPQNLETLKNHYNFEMIGESRIADRQCVVINVLPKDDYRYGYRLWIDKDSHLLVKSSLLDENKKAIEQVMFTDLKVHKTLPDHKLVPVTSGENFTHYQVDLKKELPTELKTQWRATKLPPGFKMTNHQKRPKPNKTEQMVEQIVFSDGMASVSVFVEKSNNNKKMLKGHSRMGAVNAFGRLLDEHHITVVGEVPSATVDFIGQSINYINIP